MISMRRFVRPVARSLCDRRRSSAARVRTGLSAHRQGPTPAPDREALPRYAQLAHGVRACVRRDALAILPRHSWTHPEGWRDWPYETPATTVKSQREGANSRQMCGGLRALCHTVTRRRRAKEPQWLSVICSARSARPSIRWRRCTSASAASGRWRSPTTTPARALDVGELRRRIQGGPQNIWRYADFLPLVGRPSRALRPAGLARGPAGGLHAADPRRPARRAAWPARGVGQERRRQPDPLVQGPRRVGRRRAGARARLRDDRLRVDGQPRQLRGRPRRGAGPGVLRVHPRRPRGAEGARDGRLRDQARRGETAATTTSTACAPSCAPSATGRS